MENSILKKIGNALAAGENDLQGNTNFVAVDELSPNNIHIEVEELGVLTFPLAEEDIQKLISISSKSHFGLREQTILDENIRNSHELSAEKLNVIINEHSLASMLNKIQDKLGLVGDVALIPYLHNMLIYGPGHFFDMHQDSEKLEHMVATLVVVLPTPHIGGHLLINHGKKCHTFSSENVYAKSMKCVAFYADCKHKVEKVKEGYRLALTYNLVLKSGKLEDIKYVNKELKNAINDYFATGKLLHKLVYFLNYSYTEHSLRWDMLKQIDRVSAAEMLTVAKELVLVPHLALVEIHEIWLTADYGEYYTGEPSLIELCNDDIALSYWVDEENKKIPFGTCDISKDEICWTKETKSFDPYKQEYEGYTGNEGNSMDYWYRRAAIVLWPESNQMPMCFKLNNKDAIKELTNVPGNEEKVIEMIKHFGGVLFNKPFYKVMSYPSYYKFEKIVLLVNIALYIKDKDVALSVLSAFEWKIFHCDLAVLLAKLQMQYGVSWCIDLLTNWAGHEKKCDYILSGIDSFVSNFLSEGGEKQVLELLLDVQSKKLIEYYSKRNHMLFKDSLLKVLEQTLLACATIRNVEVTVKIVEYAISEPVLYPNINLAEIYLKLQSIIPSEWFVHYKLLKAYLVETIGKDIALGIHDESDWSIEAQLPCQCEHCKIANDFLHSKTFITKRWPIKKSIRSHVIDNFRGLGIPVNLSEESTGTPHKLIMVKNSEVVRKYPGKTSNCLKLYYQKLQIQDIKMEVKDEL